MKKIFRVISKLFFGVIILLAMGVIVHMVREKIAMKNITEESKLCTVYHLPELKPVKHDLIYMGNDFSIRMLSHFMKIKSLDPNGNALYGLERVRTVLKEGERPISLYSEAECADDVEKKNAHILFFPPLTENSDKPFVIVIAGGGYAVVSNLSESYPTASKLNELGYPVFVLNYRVNNKNGLFPKPMEDLAKAVSYIYTHYDDFGLKENQEYIVGGYSAGGHISAEWGTDNEGYLKYGLPAPKALFLGYPAISPKYFLSEEKAEEMKAFRESIVGTTDYEERAEEFSVDLHVHKEYPPTYIVYCADDDMVDPNLHAAAMIKALEDNGITHLVEEGEHGGHGFAVGFHTSVDGWLDRADTFFEGLTEE